MADSLTKINFLHISLLPSQSPSPPIYNLKSSSHPLNREGKRKGKGLFVNSKSSPFSSCDFYGKGIDFKDHPSTFSISPPRSSFSSHSGLRIPKAQKWWEKGLQPNMKEVYDANDLVDALLNAGDNLLVVAFFSPGCGGCKALHPKLCQFAEMNPDVQFLQINHEDHKSMCYSLGVHVLPFFRFYRGSHGRLCSFSCTNATIKKFKDALAKHNTPRCSIGPNKGLEEKELLALAANKELSFNYTPMPVEHVPASLPVPVPVGGVKLSDSKLEPLPLPRPLPSTILKSTQDSKDNALVI